MTKYQKILIVEDELIAAHNLAEDVESLGYRVVGIFKTAEEAIDRVRCDPPDLVLMDIKLKGDLTGIEAAELLQKTGIPIIFLTAFSDNTTLDRVLETGAYGYLTKPAKIEDIKTTIAIAIKKQIEAQEIEGLLQEQTQVNQLKSIFLSTVAHDLRIPLTQILGSLEIIQYYDRKLDEAKKAKHFGRIKNAIDSMRNQLEELLTVNRAESGRLPFNPQPTDVFALSNEAIDNFQQSTDGRNPIYLTSEGDCSSVAVDTTLIEHILSNLISNAIKYSPPNNPIEINLNSHSDRLVVTVSDRGIGMPSDFLDKLFQPFERASNVGNVKGVGVGLYVVKQAVERHGGEIFAQSAIGEGTQFTVILPVSR
ncbi:Two-component sensor histidine kinase [Geitlerinema sp. FC II]|nr:Two-component sensor histidine kinase [Geitlerinema sp. FC II]